MICGKISAPFHHSVITRVGAETHAQRGNVKEISHTYRVKFDLVRVKFNMVSIFFDMTFIHSWSFSVVFPDL